MTNQQINAANALFANFDAKNARAFIKAAPLTASIEEANALPELDKVYLQLARQLRQLFNPKDELYKNDILAAICWSLLSQLSANLNK